MKTDEINELLDTEIKCQLNDVMNMEAGSSQKKSAVADLAELMRVRNEEKSNRSERKIKWAGVGIPAVLYAGVTLVGFIIERDGVVTGSALRNLMSKLKPGK